MVFRNCLGMIMSVSTFIIGRGAATPVSWSNFCIGPIRLEAAAPGLGLLAADGRFYVTVRRPLTSPSPSWLTSADRAGRTAARYGATGPDRGADARTAARSARAAPRCAESPN